MTMTRKFDESIKDTQAEVWCRENWDCQEACLPSGPEHYAQIDGVCVVCGEHVKSENSLAPCILCGNSIMPDPNGWDGGHNAQPLANGQCCGDCNDTKVTPARLVDAGYSEEKAQIMAKLIAESQNRTVTD